MRSWGHRTRALLAVPAVGIALAGAFALPIALPSDAAAQLEVRPWLGVAMDSDEAGLGMGARVGHVIRNSPADKAGLHEGDRIVTVGTSHVGRGQDVVRAIASSSVGTSVDIGFTRQGHEQTARVTLTALPSPDEIVRMDLVGAFAPTWHDVESVSGSFPSSMSALRGHVVLIDFWATWCGPCRVVIPKLGALHTRYGVQGLSVLGVSTEEAMEVAPFAQRLNIPYAVGVDHHAQMTRSYGVTNLPTLVVIDKRGVVRDVAIGYDPSEDARLESTVRSLLAERGPVD